MERLIIVGLGPTAKHVLEFVKQYELFDVIGFAVDKEFISDTQFEGYPVYDLNDLSSIFPQGEVKLFIALLWNKLNSDRRKLFERISKNGYTFANIISPYARIRGKINGTNVWIHDNVVIQNDAVIGNNVAIMALSLIGDNCIISDHCFMGAKSTVGGGSTIGEQTFIGMNCTVFDDTKIGKKCILGACTAVKRNVPDFSIYKTSSDIEIKQYTEDEIVNKLLFRKNVR